CYGSEDDQCACSDIQVSDDRVNWESISNKTSFTPGSCEDRWINVPFKSPVTAKYIRIIVATSYYVSMDEAEVWAFAE
ncbi:MAG: discoidin domain-containing protein, partial [Bacteroidales bacterium]|nr:discoidin domain-containing protein [Bacteroidales bacterium]